MSRTPSLAGPVYTTRSHIAQSDLPCPPRGSVGLDARCSPRRPPGFQSGAGRAS
jgi:hypothetical protein